MELTFKDLVGNQTVHGFDLCDTRNDKADCDREIRAEFSPDFHKNQLSVRFVRHRAKSWRSLVPHKVLECHTKRYLQIRKFGGAFGARTFFLLGIDMWKSQFQHSGWRSPFAARCKIYVVYVRLSFMTCINKC